MENSTSKVVLVTGASSGIGAAIAKAFAKQNALLSITGRNQEKLAAVAKECKSLGAKQVLEIIVDFNDKEGFEKVFKLTSEAFDKLDVLVNNAGLAFSEPLEDDTKEFGQKQNFINLLGGNCPSGYLLDVTSGWFVNKVMYAWKDKTNLRKIKLWRIFAFTSGANNFSNSNVKFENFNQLVNVNVRAPLFLTQLFVPYLEKCEGCIVNISSMVTFGSYPPYIVYGMTKAAMDHFTKTGALDLAKKNIRMNSVNPGFSATNFYADWKIDVSMEEFFAAAAKVNPLRERAIDVNEIADAVLFLSSDSARMVTGVCMAVDGGRALISQ